MGTYPPTDPFEQIRWGLAYIIGLNAIEQRKRGER